MRGFLNAGKGENGQVDQQAVDFMLAVVQGIQPQDQLEAMLAGQITVVHRAIMEATRRLTHSHAPASQLHEGALNRLARTYSTQMEALKRYRSGGQQRTCTSTRRTGHRRQRGRRRGGLGTSRKRRQSDESD